MCASFALVNHVLSEKNEAQNKFGARCSKQNFRLAKMLVVNHVLKFNIAAKKEEEEAC